MRNYVGRCSLNSTYEEKNAGPGTEEPPRDVGINSAGPRDQGECEAKPRGLYRDWSAPTVVGVTRPDCRRHGIGKGTAVPASPSGGALAHQWARREPTVEPQASVARLCSE